MVREQGIITDSLTRVAQRVNRRDSDESPAVAALQADLEEIVPLARELRSRLSRLYSQVSAWPAPLTADQESQLTYYTEWIVRLRPRLQNVLSRAGEL